jgi:hypothetical protein
MLARLAATLRNGQNLGGDAPVVTGDPGEGATLVLDENCTVSLYSACHVRSIAKLLYIGYVK